MISISKEKLDLKELKSAVRVAFKSGSPNGWLLNWDLDRFFEDIHQACQGAGKPENWTSFDYSYCNSFKIVFDIDEGSYFSMEIKVSFIANIFSIYWIRYWGGGRKGKVVEAPQESELQFVEAKVRSLLIEKGFFELPDDWYDVPVEGIELELAEKGKVTLEKCLFNDREG